MAQQALETGPDISDDDVNIAIAAAGTPAEPVAGQGGQGSDAGDLSALLGSVRSPFFRDAISLDLRPLQPALGHLPALSGGVELRHPPFADVLPTVDDHEIPRAGNGYVWNILSSELPRAVDIGDHATGRGALDSLRMLGAPPSFGMPARIVGPAIGHLPPLTNEDYLRFAWLPKRYLPGGIWSLGESEPPAVLVPTLAADRVLGLTEDTRFSGTINVDPLRPGARIKDFTVTDATVPGFVVTVDPNGQMTIDPPANFSGPFTLTYQFRDATETVRTATLSGTVAAVADPITITGGARGDEDSSIAMPIALALTDTDGSEKVSQATIAGLPAGCTVSWGGATGGVVSGSGTTADPYIITGTSAEITARMAGFHVTPPQDFAGSITLSITATAQETAPNGEPIAVATRVSSGTVTLTVDPVSDAVSIPLRASTGNEDTTFTFGSNVVWTETEVATDRSEVVTKVTVALPAGAATAGWTITPPTPPADVTITGSDATGYTITSSLSGQAGEDAIRAALDGFQISPPANSDADITLAIGVTTQDGTAAPVTANGSHTINVAARADVPTLTGSGHGNEDTFISVPLVPAVSDTDGSETISRVEITGVPTGATVAWGGVTGGTVTGTGTVGSPLVITGTEAEIKARLDALQIKPPQDSDADFNLSVTVRASETNPSGGQVDILNNDKTFTISVVVDPVSDKVIVSGSSAFNEDPVTPYKFGADITWTETEVATDRSETINKVVIGAAPSGWTLSVPSNPTDVTITGSNATGYTITSSLSGQAGEDAIRAALNDIGITPPAQSDVNAAINVTVYAKDGTAAEVASDVYSHALTVRAVADTPVATAPDKVTQPFTGDEDTRVQISGPGAVNGGITVAPSADSSDGSESFTYTITGVPANVTFYDAATGGATVGTKSGTTWTFTKAQIDAGLYVGLPAQTPGTLDLTVTATATEAATGAELSVKTATASADFRVVISTVTDPVVIGASSSTVDEAQGTTNDSLRTVINLGADLNLSLADDTDGSQDLQIELTGLPTGFTVAQVAPAGVTMTVDSVNGKITLADSGTTVPKDVLDFLKTIKVTLPSSADDRDANFTVGIKATTKEAATGVTEVTNGTHAVVINAVADTPNVVVPATDVTAVEGDGVAGIAVALGASLNDTDGSETLSVTITGLAIGHGTLEFTVSGTGSVSRDGVTGVYTLTGPASDINAMLATTLLKKDVDDSQDVTLTVRATATESNPTEAGEVAVATAYLEKTVNIVIAPRAEMPTLTVGSVTGNPPEWTTAADDIPLSGVVNVTQAHGDNDEQEALFVEIYGLPSGTTLRDGSGNLVAPTRVDAGDNVWRIAKADLANYKLRFGEDFSGDVTLKAKAVAVDTDAAPENQSDTATSAEQTVSFTIAPVADPPTVNASSSTISEDNPLATAENKIGTLITYSKNDTDGSEAVTAVEVTGFAATAGQTLTFTVNGLTISGTHAGVGDAVITATGDGFEITGSEANIRATLDTLRVQGQSNSDINVPLSVKVTVTDTFGALTSVTSTTGTHTVKVRAEADMPSVAVTNVTGTVAENGTNITLQIDPAPSADTDGSETLSVRLTIPYSGPTPIGTIATGTFGTITVADQGSGIYLVTSSATGGDAAAIAAAKAADIYAYLHAGIAFDPRDYWSGTLTGANGIKVEAISTEQATGTEVGSEATGAAGGKQAIATSYADITVTPVASTTASINVINAIGNEDTPLRLAIAVNLPDTDGSETYTVTLTGIPAGATITDASGVAITPLSGAGTANQTFSSADLARLHILPPLNYNGNNAAGDVDFTLGTTINVTDGAATSTITGPGIDVRVVGVADPVATVNVAVAATEDTAIALGDAIKAQYVDTTTILGDNDGSETLSFVIILPSGITPSAGTFNGTGWSVTAAQLVGLTIPAPANFSGDYAAWATAQGGSFSVRVVNQENDGDQRSTDLPVAITIAPVTDGLAAPWATTAGINEDNNIALANFVDALSLADGTTIAGNTPEAVTSMTLSFANLFDGAGARSNPTLSTNVVDFSDFITNYLTGSSGLTVDNAARTVTGTKDQIRALVMEATAFKDSNVDFSLTATAIIQDGTAAQVTANGTFNVDLRGVADMPTAFAANLVGNAGTPILMTVTDATGGFGGRSTDTDSSVQGPAVSQGRPTASETIYYIVSGTSGTGTVGFVDNNGATVGKNLGGGLWYLSFDDVHGPNGLRLASSVDAGGTRTMTWTTYAVENDANLRQPSDQGIATASASTNFQVTLTPTAVDTTPAPPAPSISLSSIIVNEDNNVAAAAQVTRGSGDTTSELTLIITSLPPEIIGISGADVKVIPTGYAIRLDSNGQIPAGVMITPQANFSGIVNLTGFAVATGGNFKESQSAVTNIPVTLTPVADGITAATGVTTIAEDTPAVLNLSVALRDTNGTLPETINYPITVKLNNGAVFEGLTPDGSGNYSFADAATLAAAKLVPAANFKGNITVSVTGSSTDGASVSAPETHNLTVKVTPVSDAPTMPAVGSVSGSGSEDGLISITGLTASSIVKADSSEALSVVIRNVPAGTLFVGAGATNNGDGSWTLTNPSDLANLKVQAPTNFAGTLNMTLVGISMDPGAATPAESTLAFAVTVAPVADIFVIDAQNLTADGPTPINMTLTGQDATGTLPGELPPETFELTFTNLPANTHMYGPSGTFTDLGAGKWKFEGTADAAAHIIIEPGAPGTFTVGVSGISKDGASTLATPVVDTFILTSTASATAINSTGTTGDDVMVGSVLADTLNGSGGHDTLHGGSGNDSLVGGAGNDQIFGDNGNDTLTGGTGIDILTGGAGADTFLWLSGDATVGGTPDHITDFTVGQGDKLDLTALLVGYDHSDANLSKYIHAVEAGGNTTIQISATGNSVFNTDVVILDGVTGLDLLALKQAGQLAA